MAFNFNLFQPKRAARIKSTEPIVEVKPSGQIAFNKQACDLLESKRFCMLGYDPENKAIGLLPTSDSDRNAFAVRYTTKGAYVGAKSFFKHLSLLPQSALQVPPQRSGNFIAIRL
jgi:hypothetical protein